MIGCCSAAHFCLELPPQCTALLQAQRRRSDHQSLQATAKLNELCFRTFRITHKKKRQKIAKHHSYPANSVGWGSVLKPDLGGGGGGGCEEVCFLDIVSSKTEAQKLVNTVEEF